MYLISKAFTITVLLTVLIGHANAAGGIPTPDTLDGGQIVDARKAKSLLDSNAAFIVDVRNPVNYGRGHIPNATLVPYKGKSIKAKNFDPAQDRFDLSRLPADKGMTLLFYSHGITGWKSYKAALTAVRAGYSDVRWMREGYGKWLELGYPTTP